MLQSCILRSTHISLHCACYFQLSLLELRADNFQNVILCQLMKTYIRLDISLGVRPSVFDLTLVSIKRADITLERQFHSKCTIVCPIVTFKANNSFAIFHLPLFISSHLTCIVTPGVTLPKSQIGPPHMKVLYIPILIYIVCVIDG